MDRPLTAKRRALRAGEIIEFEGAHLKMIPGKEYGDKLVPGDTYYACRNTEQLFTVKHVNKEKAWVEPVEDGYLFDLVECVGVEILES